MKRILNGVFVLFMFTWESSGARLDLNDQYLNVSPLRTIQKSSLFDCSASCDQDSKCKSFNFYAPALECQLNSDIGKDEDLIERKRSYFGKKKIPYSPSLCPKLNCKDNQLCHLNRGDNPPTCVQRDFHVKDVTHNCYDVIGQPNCHDLYTLTATEVLNLPVYCDLTTDGGGWLVFQRRMDGSEDFYRTWNEYKDGFGDLSGEFWLGNENIHKITKQQTYELRIDLEDFKGNKTYAMYSNFSLGSKEDNYTLHIGNYSGNAGDSLSRHNGAPFTAKDKDFDTNPENCAVQYGGAWWYESCYDSNLNGLYLKGNTDQYATGVVWRHWTGYYYSLKTTEMKMRPKFN